MEWIAFRSECVRRRTYYDLQGKQKRLHLLRGLEAILLDIDKAIEIVRNTAEESEVVPNLMIGFGIDEVQAEYVAEIKLRHLNREYILKRTEEIEELEKAIADLEDVLKRPARIRKIIMTELGDVAKKYGSPRKTEILYDLPDDSAADEQNEIPDYPVTVFFTREGYFKKITPQSLRMSGEQKLKDGDEVVYTKETTNSAELLFFTNHAQVYKSRASEFADTKASVLGDYVASKLEMEEGEVPLFMTVTVDYRGYMLFFYQNGKCAKIPLASYMTKQNRRKLLKAYSDKEELAAMLHIEEETELAVFTSGGTGGPRLILVGSALIPEKATRDTAGINMVTLKKNARIAKVRPAAVGTKVDWELPKELNGYTLVKSEGTDKTVGTGGLTVTCYYKAKEDRPSASFIITDESGAEADKTLKAGKFKAKLTLPEGRKTAAVIIAKYVNGTLGDLKMSEPKETQAIIETDFITVTGEDLTKQTEIKAFVFESTENIKPMYGFQHIIK